MYTMCLYVLVSSVWVSLCTCVWVCVQGSQAWVFSARVCVYTGMVPWRWL